MTSYDFTPEVGEPLDRDVVREQEQGFLVSCNSGRCEWMGLFPEYEQAMTSLESHIKYEREDGAYHYGKIDWTVLKLQDKRTAAFVDGDAGLGGGQPSQYTIEKEATWLRSAADDETVAGLVRPGIHIDNYGYGEGVVVSVNERWACGLPCFSIIYVPLGTSRNDDGTYPESAYKYMNQMVAVDGEVYRQWEHDHPEFETKGLAEGHQMTFGAVGGTEP
jgi:hypothetical protein